MIAASACHRSLPVYKSALVILSIRNDRRNSMPDCIRDVLEDKTKDYLSFMAEKFPVMSSSDEFIFFPLAEESWRFRGHMEDLSEELIQTGIDRAEQALSVVEQAGRETTADLDCQIDAWLLKMHARNYLRSFELEQGHLTDPSLYFSIAAHGLARVAGDPVSLAGRIRAAVALFRKGQEQLSRSSAQKVRQGLIWSENFRNLLALLAVELPEGDNSAILSGFDSLRDAADSFSGRIESLEISDQPESLGRDRYALILEDAYGLEKDPFELYELLLAERARLRELLQAGAVRLGFGADQWMLAAVDSPTVSLKVSEPIELYRAELDRLTGYLAAHPDAGDIDTGEVPGLSAMPGYLQGLRTSASYAAPLGPGRRGTFYVGFKENGSGDDSWLAMHSDYRYITVHETFPGHHHLDTVRRNLKSAVRSQSENALFYEGWACRAEQRMAEFGYFTRPNELMCLERRKYQRCLRSICELGLHLGLLDDNGAAALLEEFNWRGKIVENCLLQYRCQPSYQLTYTIGRLEMEKLVGKYSSAASCDSELYGAILEVGEVPFGLLDRFLESRLCGTVKSSRPS
jgi:Bacterial protein of unknown function (DUF885)